MLFFYKHYINENGLQVWSKGRADLSKVQGPESIAGSPQSRVLRTRTEDLFVVFTSVFTMNIAGNFVIQH